MNRSIIILILFTTCSILIIGCSNKESNQKAQDYVVQDSLVIIYKGIDSMNVLEILLRNHDVHTVSSGMGTFVRGIDSIENSSEAFWLYSVNDTIADRAADNYMTKTGDIIKWHYRFINQPDNLSDSVK